MRVEIQQAIAQTPNVDRVQVNVSNPQVAESIRHAQNIAEKVESQMKAEVVVEINKSENIEPIKDEERKRKALLTRKGEEKEERSEKENEREEKNKNQKDKKIHREGRKIDIRA
ncbi:MAG: hypothetical protein RRA63_09470 [Candidatus Calescibacterium sp.]|nr:hypothetical protein [Candidatus Calescibacterium sp.]